MANLFLYIALFLLWFMLFYHIFLMLGGYLAYLRHDKTVEKFKENEGELPNVSILIPAHNEQLVIEHTLESMINLTYPKDKLEIVVINDNSSDNTGAIVDAFAERYSFIRPLHTTPESGGKGKARALNQGLEYSTGEVIVVYDADNTPDPDAVYNLVLGLNNDKEAGAVVGKFRVSNANKNLLTRFINIETLTFQWLAQAGRWHWFKMTTIPGTNFAIRRSVIEELGGWDEKAISEDTELSFRLYNLGYHIRFFPEAVTWEQEPETLKVWWKQRMRWAQGNEYVIFKFLSQFRKLNGKVRMDLFYFLFTYLFFFGGILVSHIIFILNLIFDLDLMIGNVSVILLVTGFLLFLVEVWLSISFEEGQFNLKNALTSILMYFIYSQMWVILVLVASYREIKRVLMNQEVKWEKTERVRPQQRTPQVAENVISPQAQQVAEPVQTRRSQQRVVKKKDSDTSEG